MSITSACGTSLALRLLGERRLEISPLVTHRFALCDYPQAIQTAIFAGRHKAVKTVFDFTGENQREPVDHAT